MNTLHNIQISAPKRRHILNCRNLTIKPITINEITSDYISWLNKKEINQFLEVRHQNSTPKSVAEYINYTRSIPGCEFFAIFVNENVHIGNINLTSFNLNNNGYAQYGIMIGNENAQKLGLGGLASIMFVEYLLSFSEIRKIECSVISLNEKSWKTIESLGFVREGILREHFVLADDNYADNYLYGIFKNEWIEKRMQFSALLRTFTITSF